MMRKKVWIALFLFVIGGLPATARANTEPEQFVASLFDEFYAAFSRTATHSNQQVRLHLADLYFAYFDSQRIAAFVLGKARRRASAEQQKEFEVLFPHFLFTLFYPQMDHYFTDRDATEQTNKQTDHGDKLKILSSRSVRRDTLVDAQFSGVKPTAVAVRLRPNQQQQWRVLDIEIAGVSMLLTQRDVISGLLQKHQYDFSAFLEEVRLSIAPKTAT